MLAFSDGYTIVPLPATQDHKRIGENDTGLNTGGMGAYSPAPIATQEIMDQIKTKSLQPTVDGMRKEGKGVDRIYSMCLQVIVKGSLSSASFSLELCSPRLVRKSWSIM